MNTRLSLLGHTPSNKARSELSATIEALDEGLQCLLLENQKLKNGHTNPEQHNYFTLHRR